MPGLAGRSLVETKTLQVEGDRTNLVIYLSSHQLKGRTIETAKYAELLWRRYRNDGLGITAIVRGDIPDLNSLIEHSLVHYDIIMDPHAELGDVLGVREGESAIFLFGPDGRCRFSTRNPIKAEDMRQIVAVEFLKKDPLDRALFLEKALEPGQPLASKSLLDVRSLVPTSFDEIRNRTSGLFVFFTADCSVCSLPGYLKSFAEFDHKRRSMPNQERDAVLVFDFNFSHTDVVDQLKQSNIISAAYIAGEELTEVNNLALMNSSKFGQAIAVQIDKQGLVQKILSLAELSGETEEGRATAVRPEPVESDNPEAEFEEVFRGASHSIYDVAAHNGKYYISDIKGNRILVLNGHGEVEKEIGGIGSAPGRVLHPGCIDVAADGTLYVQDGGNERIQRFAPDGSYAGEFHTGLYEGFAVSPMNEIYLGQPENGHLVTVYSSSGKKLRSFGEPKKFSQAYGSEFAYKDDLYNLAINRVRLFVDREGDIYVSFMLAPIIQKYDTSGRLLFERRLEGPETDRLTRVLLTDTLDKYLSISMDGFEARVIALDPVVDPSTGNIYILLVDGSIYCTDKEGGRISVLRPRSDRDFTPYGAGLGAKGELLAVSFFTWRCYRVKVKSI